MGNYKPKPQGYIDSQELNRAQRAARQALRDVERILEERPNGAMFWHLLAKVAHALAEIVNALAEMERIRLQQ